MGSDLLFAQPSFWIGVARLLDLGGAFDAYNESPTGEVADARATYADWRITGEDLARAMTDYRDETRAEQLSLELSPVGEP